MIFGIHNWQCSGCLLRRVDDWRPITIPCQPPPLPTPTAQPDDESHPHAHLLSRRAADYVKESGLPSFLNERTLEVETPSGKQTIPNPFLGYTIDR